MGLAIDIYATELVIMDTTALRNSRILNIPIKTKSKN